MNFEVGNTNIGNDLPLNIIAGPCQLESSEHSLMIAKSMADACAKVVLVIFSKGHLIKPIELQFLESAVLDWPKD